MQNPHLKNILIAPPFGRYLKFKETSNVYGSFTYERRKGLIKQCIKTIRKIDKNAWRNKIGLRNPGLPNIKPLKRPQDIISLAALEMTDWQKFADILNTKEFADCKNIEINIGCPNAMICDFPKELVSLYKNKNLIVKFPPNIDINARIAEYLEVGITTFHLCNTLPSDRGGISGYPLKALSVPAVKSAREKFGDKITLIGGGGVYSVKDAKEYLDAGADHLSLSSIMFNPFRGSKLVREIYKLF